MRMKSKAPTRPPANKAAGRRLDTKSPARGRRRETPMYRRRRGDDGIFPFPPVPDDASPTPPRMTDPHRFFGTRGHDQALVLARMTPHAEANSSLDVPSLPAFYTRVIS